MPTTRLFEVNPNDAKRVSRKLRLMGRYADNTYPAMQRIALDMMRVTGVQFRSHGRRGGGSWRGLKDTTKLKKGNTQILKTKGSLPGYSSIGGSHMNADTLFQSLVTRGAPFQILNIRKQQVEYGTIRPYAKMHQEGYAKRSIPPRPFIVFLPGDRRRWEEYISRHIVRPFTRLRF